MKLKPVIASYSGAAFSAARQCLTDEVLEVIAGIAQAPRPSAEIPRDVLAELVEMHVLQEQDGRATLNTAVFMQDDMERIVGTVRPLAQELSRRILESGAAFQGASPEVTVFLGGLIGFVQGSGAVLRQQNVGVDWKSYTGKYAQTKVDFDELCDLYEAIGPDCLNKTVLQGARYTAVFIGPGGDSFESLLYAVNPSDVSRRYIGHLNRYLVDAYARLVAGEVEDESLREAAEVAGLYEQGRPRTAVITDKMVRRYEGAIRAIIATTSAYYMGKLGTLDALLRATTPGRQGVPPANMILHLWRYIRKLTAKELYASGFLTDSIPEKGVLTVFYEHDAALIRQLLM